MASNGKTDYLVDGNDNFSLNKVEAGSVEESRKIQLNQSTLETNSNKWPVALFCPCAAI